MGRKKNLGRICEICGSSDSVALNEKTKKLLCGRHRQQVSRYGKILETTKFEDNAIVIYEDYAEIILRNMYFEESARAIISIDKINKIKGHSWHLRKGDGYVECRINNKSVLLHRYLMGVVDKERDIMVDHINRNKLDNRNENLRIVTNSQNQTNKKIMNNNTSGTTGVTWDKARGKWKVSLNINKKCYNLGRFDTLEEAIDVRLKAEKLYHKEYAPIERR